MTQVFESDVLVIGGGAAGARAALEAHRAGAKVILAVKGRFGVVGSRGMGASAAGSGQNALYTFFAGILVNKLSSSEEEKIYKTIIQAGLGLADPDLARALVEESPRERGILEKWGVLVPPLKAEKTIWGSMGGLADGGLRPIPGLSNIVRADGIALREKVMLTSLIMRDGSCLGAVGIDEDSGEPLVFKTPTTILAAGGDAQLYMHNTHPSCVTGDSHAMGYEAGGELMNMEFMQTFAGSVYPQTLPGQRWFWEQFPKLYNTKGEEFLKKYLPAGASVQECMKQRSLHGPFSSRDTLSKYVDISITKEIKAGRGSEYHTVYADVPRPADAPEWIKDWFRYRGLDLWRPLNMAVYFQCSNGGLRINVNAQTTVPGLYAIGEAAIGPWGADRLGGQMQAACQVFGVKAGKHAAATAKKKGKVTVSDSVIKEALESVTKIKESHGDQNPGDVRKRLQKKAWENMLVVKDKKSITQVIEEIDLIEKDLVPRLSVTVPRDIVRALELKNLLTVGRLIANAALTRQESRGGYYREDFPQQDDVNWRRNITIKKLNGKMQVGTVVLQEKWTPLAGDLKDFAHWG